MDTVKRQQGNCLEDSKDKIYTGFELLFLQLTYAIVSMQHKLAKHRLKLRLEKHCIGDNLINLR